MVGKYLTYNEALCKFTHFYHDQHVQVQLVVEPPISNILVKLDHFHKDRGKKKSTHGFSAPPKGCTVLGCPVTASFGKRLGSVGYVTPIYSIHNWLVVSTPLKNISQNGNLPQIGVKIKNI